MTAILRSTMMPNSLFKLAGGLEKQRDLQEVHHPALDRGEDGPAVDGHLQVSVGKDEHPLSRGVKQALCCYLVDLEIQARGTLLLQLVF